MKFRTPISRAAFAISKMHIQMIQLLLLQILLSFSVTDSLTSNATDQHALLSFKQAFIYDPYNNLQSWNNGISLCKWTGVECSSWNQRVIGVNISGMNIQAPFSPFLANISFLEVLDISNNHFYGHIPRELRGLVGLRELWLDRNELQGPIPDTIGGCSNLTVLSLSQNHLGGSIPRELGLLTKLKKLDLGLNNLTGTVPLILGQLPGLVDIVLGENNLYGPIPASLSNCTLLKRIVLHENKLSGAIPSEFGAKLAHLQELHLWGNNLIGNIPVSLTNCSQLRLLFLNENWFTGIVPEEFGKLALLESLYLHGNQLVSTPTLPFLTALTNCSHLQKIDVSNNPLGGVLPVSIGLFSEKLILLDISNNSIHGSIPREIGNLTSLTYLALADNLLSGSIPSELSMLNRLERLRLRNNKLGGSIPTEISQLRNIGSISIRQNMLSGPIPHSLGDLKQLRRLLLSENQLSGTIPATLGKCWRLELLDLSWNRLTGSIPREVASLSNLQFYFNISHNFLEGSLPPEISKMTMVQTIDISFNQLTGVIPAALGSCTELVKLNLSHNTFQGPIPDTLGGLKNSEKLDLSSNNLSGAIPMTLGKLKLLHTLNLSFNNLRGEIPNEGIFLNITFNSLMGNPGLCGQQKYLPLCPPSASLKQRNHSALKNVIIPVAGGGTFVICCLLIGFFLSRRLHNKTLCLPIALSLQFGQAVTSLEDLVKATQGFNEANLIGVGSFGSVYKGILHDGTEVAVKVLKLQNEEAYKSFNTECDVLRRIRHRNLIRVISSCSTPHFKALVLQLMSNGSLENHLYPSGDEGAKEDVHGLNLSHRVQICTEIAHSVAYLHHYCFVQVVHCDIKPSNILLDSNMTAHLSDFGIAQLTCANLMDSITSTLALKGSIGYIAPEYGFGSTPSTKGDVYSFGILLLEMMTRKRPTDNMFVEGLNLPKWVRMAFPDRIGEVMDTSLLRGENIDALEQHEILNCVNQLVALGLVCTRESPEERPTMTEVVTVLERIRKTVVGDWSHLGLQIAIRFNI
eukprot:PITA_01759